MSERSGGVGAFLFGIAVGAVVGFFFAPEAGEGTRRKVSKQLRNLRELAEDKVDEVRDLLAEDAEAEADDDSAEDPEQTREQLRRRLQAARRRRNRPAVRGREGERDEEDEPLA